MATSDKLFPRSRSLVLLLALVASAFLLCSKTRKGENQTILLPKRSYNDGLPLLLRQRTLLARESLGHFHRLFTDDQARDNAFEILEWRREFDTKCGTAHLTKDQIATTLRVAFKPSRVKRGTHEDSLPIEPCLLTFLDLGSSVGDSLGKFIDAGLPTCEKKRMNPSRYDPSTGFVGTTFYGSRKNPLVAWLTSVLQNATDYPENYCYFGMEGNSFFTDQLKQLERQVMRSHPRPLRRAHFFTSSVVADQDGPTTLTIDAVNAQNHNFLGSSLVATRRDAESSTQPNPNSTTTISTTVEGYTLSTLLEHTVIQTPGARVIIKMDVESVEYQVFQDALPALCNFTATGVTIDFLLAVHDTDVAGDTSSKTTAAMDAYGANKIKALECGINLFEGDYGQ